MANDLRDDEYDAPSVGTSQAREALAQLNADGSRLAERAQTPWWYHPVVAFFAAVFVWAPAAQSAGGATAIALGVVGLMAFTTLYGRRVGVSIERPAGPRSRRALLVSVGIVLVGMIVSGFIGWRGATVWWGFVPAAVVFGASILLGLRYEAELRAELVRNGEGLA